MLRRFMPFRYTLTIRSCVTLLIAVVVLMAICTIGWLHRFYARRHHTEAITSEYHLATILYVGRINEELARLQTQIRIISNNGPESADDLNVLNERQHEELRHTAAQAMYVVGQHVDAVSRLQAQYANSEFSNVLHRLEKQRADFDALIETDNREQHRPATMFEQIDRMSRRSEQMRRLHVIVHQRLQEDLKATESRAVYQFMIFIAILLIVGGGVGHQIIRSINTILAARDRSEEELRIIRDELELKVERRTADLKVINEQLEEEVNERRRAEEELRKSRDELETRVERRTNQLKVANAQLHQEIAERTRAEEKEAGWGRILEESLTGIHIFDVDTLMFTEINRGAWENLGYTLEEMRELRACDLKPEYTEGAFREFIHPLRERKVDTLEMQTIHRRKDGSEYPVEIHFHLSSLESKPVIVAMILDITERRQAEEDRLTYLDQVEEARVKHEEQAIELKHRACELWAAQERAQEANHAKSVFLANMSHELRTPMNSIMGFTRRLLKRLGDSLGEQDRDALETVDRNARHLLGLINDILDLSKIEAGRMELQQTECDLVSLVRDVVSQTASLTDNKPIELVTDLPDAPVSMMADRVKCVQIVTNLISNGIKYTEKGTVTVTVRTDEDAQLGSVACVDVKDTGVGMTPEGLSRLFDKFTQLDASSTRRAGGTGLGLFITREYVEMHGGRIDVQSQYGKGSTFSVLLPLDRTARDDGSGSDAPQREEQTRVKILCVDDDSAITKFLEFTLHRAGYHVLVAHNYDTAIDMAKRHRPDLISLDIDMPGRDGYDVLRELQSDPALASVPVIVVSGMNANSKAVASGARCYLEKPVTSEQVLSTVERVLAHRVDRVLVIDDDQDTTKLIAQTLRENGVAVRTASSGREGLACVAQWQPTVIVLDLLMPEMDGFEVLDRLEQEPEWANIPVVILSVKTLTHDESERLEKRCASVVTKGRDDTAQVLAAVFRSTLPSKNVSEEALT